MQATVFIFMEEGLLKGTGSRTTRGGVSPDGALGLDGERQHPLQAPLEAPAKRPSPARGVSIDPPGVASSRGYGAGNGRARFRLDRL
jgi:hypothetical protein